MEHAQGFDVICFGWVILQSSAVITRFDLSRYSIRHCDDSGRTCIRLKPYNRRRTWWRHQMETFSALLAICAGWRGALMLSLICVWINGWANKREADDLRRYRAHYDVTAMTPRPDGWAMGCLCDNGEMSDRWLFLVELCVQGIK